MFELMDAYSQSAVIKVLGVGGGGGNAVSHMVTSGIEGVEFMCINTDAQALKHSKVKTALQIGCNITKGLGAGADPEIGRQAAMEDRDRVIELIEGCDMLFITAGMGGGTGTGAAPVVAQLARELGILTVAVVTRPFSMEGNKRALVADAGMSELAKHVDSLITIPNQKLLTVLGPKTTLLDAFRSANQVLQGAVQGIADLITRPGLINVDFADVRTVMAETGMAMMGSGNARGDSRAREAAEMAVSSPLLEDVNLSGAHGILVNVTEALRDRYQTTVALIHHTTKDGKMYRGSSALLGAVSWQWIVALNNVAEPNYIRVTCERQKDGKPFAPLTLTFTEWDDTGYLALSQRDAWNEREVAIVHALIDDPTTHQRPDCDTPHPWFAAAPIRPHDIISRAWQRGLKALVTQGILEQRGTTRNTEYRWSEFAVITFPKLQNVAMSQSVSQSRSNDCDTPPSLKEGGWRRKDANPDAEPEGGTIL